MNDVSPLLELIDVRAGYNGGTVLHDVSIPVAEGGVHALVGHNGAGKSTLLDVVTGLTRATSGRIVLAGADVTNAPAHRRARRGVGYVPQGRRVFKSVTVAEHLAIAYRKPKSGRARWTPQSVVELFPRLGERRSHRGWQLSGGEQQMLAIARALLTGPRLLVMDEPTEGLAPAFVDVIHKAVSALADEGMTILLAAPQPEWPIAVAETISVLSAGRHVADFSGDSVRRDSGVLLEALALNSDH